MLFNTFTAGALLVAVAAAAPAAAPAEATPTLTYPGPPVVYQVDASAPLVTATALAGSNATALRLRRDTNICQPQPSGIEYKTNPDTFSAFSIDRYYSNTARAAKTPLGFTQVFKSIKASVNAPNYLGFTLMDTYDVQTCADKCNAIDGCTSFNVYFERNPSVNPNDKSCSNPPGVTNIKCVWWSDKITTDQAVNKGQYQNKFRVVIAGSNGYVGTPTQRGFRIKTDGSGTGMDGRWLAVSPGEGAAVALNPVEYKAQTSLFQFGHDGSLIQIAPFKDMAAYATRQDGAWSYMRFRSVGQPKEYIKCMSDNIINCRTRAGDLAAGVCPDRKTSISGLLYLGLREKMDPGCKQIGLYVDLDTSGVAM